jgi:hypothetical protein
MNFLDDNIEAHSFDAAQRQTDDGKAAELRLDAAHGDCSGFVAERKKIIESEDYTSRGQEAHDRAA